MVHRAGVSSRRIGAIVIVLALVLLAAGAGNDPLLYRQYHLRKVRADEAWDAARGRDVVIAVLDTGVKLGHPDLRGRLVPGIDLVERDTPPSDGNGHGTFVAGVAVATFGNAKGGSGVAPRAKVMPVRVLDDEGNGTSDVVAEGIRWATREGADVINLSLSEVPGQDKSAASLITTDVELAIRQAALDGVVVVCAAGNDGEKDTPYARNLPALVVGATDRDDVVWKRSNYDERTIFAPGVEIVSTYAEVPYAQADGTSFAAPIVSAAAALLVQKGYGAQGTRDRLENTARPVGKGVGRVDVAAALGLSRRVRTKPSPRPEPTESESEASEEPAEPQPVIEPKRVRPPRTPRQPPTEATPTAKPRPQRDDEPRKVAKADKPRRRNPAKPSPVPQPTAAADGTPTAAGEPGDTPPVWPFVVAGVLLFVVVVGIGGYITARRSG